MTQAYLRGLCINCNFLPEHIGTNSNIDHFKLWDICRDEDRNFQILVPLQWNIHKNLEPRKAWVRLYHLEMCMSINSALELAISNEDERRIRDAIAGIATRDNYSIFNETTARFDWTPDVPIFGYEFFTKDVKEHIEKEIINETEEINENPEWDKLILIG